MRRQTPRIPRGLAQPLADARLCFTSRRAGKRQEDHSPGEGCVALSALSHNGTVFADRCSFWGGTQWEGRPHASHSQGQTFTSSIP